MTLGHWQQIRDFLYHHPQWGGLLTFLIAFVESLAVLGTIIPGSVTMTAVGVLIGTGTLAIASTVIWAITGALSGDILSYLFGRICQGKIDGIWPFKKYNNLLQLGEKFFERHGGKSVVIGRFVGPVRSLVPLIAGLLNMPSWRFFFAATISASSWALVYLTPGIVLGALSIELPPHLAAQLIFYSLGLILLGWLASWIIHACFRRTWHAIDQYIAQLWHWMRMHHGMRLLPRLLTNPRAPKKHRQLALLFLALGSLALFALISWDVIHQSDLTRLNQPIYYFLTSLHNKFTNDLMLIVSLLSDTKPLLIAGLGILSWLVWREQWWAALHWLVIITLTPASVLVLKHWMHAPRPISLLKELATSSYPSGHTTLSVALFSFIAVLIATDLHSKRRRMPYKVATGVCLLVAFSRIYLGSHWFSDVMGSVLLGISIVLFATISYRRKERPVISVKLLAIVSIFLFYLCGFAYTLLHFNKGRYQYASIESITSTTLPTWWKQGVIVDPPFRRNRFGRPVAAMNIQWLGSLATLRASLIQKGWKAHPPNFNTLNNALRRFSERHTQHQLPLFPQLYQGHSTHLVMTKSLGKRQFIVLRLWKSNTHITDTRLDPQLWTGTLSGALTELTSDLSQRSILYKKVRLHLSSDILKQLNWNQKLLLIREAYPTNAAPVRD